MTMFQISICEMEYYLQQRQRKESIEKEFHTEQKKFKVIDRLIDL